MKRRHNFDIEKEWIVATAGVVPAITYAVQEFTARERASSSRRRYYYPFKRRCYPF
jgi:bifunctional pyridoxal-dependent enzyme with beta-cystathionase and maltose regulon repressor activities